MKNLILLFLLIPVLCFAQIPQPQPNTYVNDFAHVLDTGQITALNQSIANIERASTVQFAIVLIDKLPAGTTIEDYTLQLARQWHVGTNKNGLVYVASLQDHKQRIEKASGLDSVFTHQQDQDILNAIKPFFKSKDYFGGLQTLVSQVSTTLKVGEAPAQDQTQQAPVQQQTNMPVQQDDNDNSGAVAVVIFVFIAIIVVAIIKANRRNNYRRRPPYDPNMGPGYDGGGPSGGGFFLGGLLGALGLYTVERIMDNDNSDQQTYDNGDNNDPGYDNGDNDSSSSWGDWGGGSDSSSDSGFSGGDSGGDSSSW